MTTDSKNRPIGVFDSGIGGLTVYKALREALPQEDFIYLGDTARLPYGTKSHETVAAYALQAAQLLLEHDIKLLVVACNTASAQALPELRRAFPDLPCLGVIEPGADAAVAASHSGRIAVLATEGTARSGAYVEAIQRRSSAVEVQVLACNLLVALVEEGWCDGAEAEVILRRYLHRLEEGFDTLVLGCTHFPILAPMLRKIVSPSISIIDSAVTAAQAVREYLQSFGQLAPSSQVGSCHCLVTDGPERFERVARLFLNEDIAGKITQVYLRQR